MAGFWGVPRAGGYRGRHRMLRGLLGGLAGCSDKSAWGSEISGEGFPAGRGGRPPVPPTPSDNLESRINLSGYPRFGRSRMPDTLIRISAMASRIRLSGYPRFGLFRSLLSGSPGRGIPEFLIRISSVLGESRNPNPDIRYGADALRGQRGRERPMHGTAESLLWKVDRMLGNPLASGR